VHDRDVDACGTQLVRRVLVSAATATFRIEADSVLTLRAARPRC
jgi:hypothetical protein